MRFLLLVPLTPERMSPAVRRIREELVESSISSHPATIIILILVRIII
jgi:hypothetical protein